MKQLSDKSPRARHYSLSLLVFFFALTFTVNTQAQAGRSPLRTFVSATASDNSNFCSRSSPCRALSSAVDAVIEGGEVVILNTGEFDAVQITKSVRIVAPEGVHAVIAPVTGIAVPGATNGDTTAVLVNAPVATVVLRNIVVQHQGQVEHGISVTSVGRLQIENCIIDGFNSGGSGIFLGAKGTLMVRDTTARNNSNGIFITTPAGSGVARVSIDRCQLTGNFRGVFASGNSRVAVTNTVAAGTGAGVGFFASSNEPVELNCDSCVASFLTQGFVVSGGSGVMRVARSMATNNGVGFTNVGGTFKSLAGTNMVDGNVTNRGGAITTLNPDVP